MPHHIYTTDAIILHREPLDVSASYIIVTRELGLVRARAQGVRQAHSRLKGALQDFSSSTVSFVHGKNGWKITTAIPDRNFFNESHDTETRKIIARISNSLVRLIAGEEKNSTIFDTVSKGFSALVENKEGQSSIEALILLRVLHTLGYISVDEHTAPLLTDFNDFRGETITVATVHKGKIIQAINKGFQESQL